MNKHLETLMQKEMSRKEFLAAMGLGVATVLGFGSIIRLLNGKSSLHKNSSGYGSNSYGN